MSRPKRIVVFVDMSDIFVNFSFDLGVQLSVVCGTHAVFNGIFNRRFLQARMSIEDMLILYSWKFTKKSNEGFIQSNNWTNVFLSVKFISQRTHLWDLTINRLSYQFLYSYVKTKKNSGFRWHVWTYLSISPLIYREIISCLWDTSVFNESLIFFASQMSIDEIC